MVRAGRGNGCGQVQWLGQGQWLGSEAMVRARGNG